MEHLYRDLVFGRDESNLFENKKPEWELTKEERMDWIAVPICNWYEEHKRILPWRRNTNPYRIWVSEIMLQQTRVEAVKPYFERFMQQLPDVASLAKVEDDTLMKLWEGLGYYSRARNLKKAAEICAEKYNGNLPDSYEQLLLLPGIGSYTAGAIASIAFGEQKPAVDGNVLRVIFRVFACRDNILSQKVKKTLEIDIEKMIKRTGVSAGILNQALMELGACVCIPNGAPLCEQCPLNPICLAYKEHLTDEIPFRESKKPRRKEERTVFIVEDKKYLVLGKRSETGLLAGLYELPGKEEKMSEEKAKQYWREMLHTPVKAEKIQGGTHIFSHVEWQMGAWHILLPETLATYKIALEENGFLVIPKAAVKKEYAIPSAFSAWKKFWEEEA